MIGGKYFILSEDYLELENNPLIVSRYMLNPNYLQKP